MGWLDWAINDPAPAGLCGYSGLNVPCEVAPDLRYGMLWHSAEGEFWGPPSELMRVRGVSWDATVGQAAVFRHRPRPTFVNYHGGGPAQNIGLVGIEVAGANGQPWTTTQRGLILRVALDTWRYFGWQPIVLGYRTDRTQAAIRTAILGRGRGSLWEHIWVKATSCPGGRDDWAWLMAALETALIIEEDDMLRFIKKASSGTVYATDGIYKWGIPSMTILREMKAKGLATGEIQTVSDGLFNRIKGVPRLRQPLTAAQTQTEVKRAINAYGGKFRQWCREAIVSTGINIPNVHKSIQAAIARIQAGSGLTKAETVDAVKKANKEGTG